MTEQTECRWSWGRPDKPGLWWYRQDVHLIPGVVMILKPERQNEMWWAYIGPIPPEPLPPRKKVTQTLWMITSDYGLPEGWKFFQKWLGPDDTIPPGAIETVQTREIEL